MNDNYVGQSSVQAGHINLTPSLITRFWAKVIVVNNSCWRWRGSRTKGYGSLHLGKAWKHVGQD